MICLFHLHHDQIRWNAYARVKTGKAPNFCIDPTIMNFEHGEFQVGASTAVMHPTTRQPPLMAPWAMGAVKCFLANALWPPRASFDREAHGLQDVVKV